jgi:hypothetical protein
MWSPAQQKAIIQRGIIEGISKEKEQIRVQTVQAMMAATLMTLHDEYDWKPDNLVTIMAKIFDQFDSVSRKFVKIQDFYDWLESIGIEVKYTKAKEETK